MITVDGPISFLVGGGIALACRKRAGAGVIDRDRTLLRGMLLQSLVLTPVILFFMVRYPDWEWNYLFDARAFFFDDGIGVGAPLLALIAAAITASHWLGFRVVEALLQTGRIRIAGQLLVTVGILVGAVMAWMWEQTLWVGTLAEWQAGEATLIFLEPGFLAAQTVAGLLLVPGIAWIIWRARQHGG